MMMSKAKTICVSVLTEVNCFPDRNSSRTRVNGGILQEFKNSGYIMPANKHKTFLVGYRRLKNSDRKFKTSGPQN